MEIFVARDKNLETHNALIKFIRFFSVPLLNWLPPSLLQKFMRGSSKDAGAVVENVGSAKALEVMYGRYRRKLFSRGFMQGIADLLWHHCVSQAKGLRNRLRIVEDALDAEILNITSQKSNGEIRMLTIGGGSARGIVEVLNKRSENLKGFNVFVTNVDKSEKAIELGKELAKEFGLYDNFIWINDLAQNIENLVPENSVDVVEMVGLLDYFSDEKSKIVFSHIYNILKRGGLFMVGNVIPNEEQKFIDDLGWPKMHYRTPESLAKLLTESGFNDSKGKIIIEPLKNHIVAVVKK